MLTNFLMAVFGGSAGALVTIGLFIWAYDDDED
jgi:hypothetical protein